MVIWPSWEASNHQCLFLIDVVSVVCTALFKRIHVTVSVPCSTDVFGLLSKDLSRSVQEQVIYSTLLRLWHRSGCMSEGKRNQAQCSVFFIPVCCIISVMYVLLHFSKNRLLTRPAKLYWFEGGMFCQI